MKRLSRWFHYTDILWCTVSKTFSLSRSTQHQNTLWFSSYRTYLLHEIILSLLVTLIIAKTDVSMICSVPIFMLNEGDRLVTLCPKTYLEILLLQNRVFALRNSTGPDGWLYCLRLSATLLSLYRQTILLLPQPPTYLPFLFQLQYNDFT
jgi:hypothetical protein